MEELKQVIPHGVSDDEMFGYEPTGPVAKRGYADEDFRPQIASQPLQGGILFMPLEHLTSGVSRSNSTIIKSHYGIDRVVARMILEGRYMGADIFVRN